MIYRFVYKTKRNGATVKGKGKVSTILEGCDEIKTKAARVIAEELGVDASTVVIHSVVSFEGKRVCRQRVKESRKPEIQQTPSTIRTVKKWQPVMKKNIKECCPMVAMSIGSIRQAKAVKTVERKKEFSKFDAITALWG